MLYIPVSQQIKVLKDNAEFAAEFMHIAAGNASQINPGYLAEALFEGQCCIKRFEQAALAAAGFSNNIGEFPLADIQADIFENHAAVRLANVSVGEFYDAWHLVIDGLIYKMMFLFPSANTIEGCIGPAKVRFF